MKAASLKQQHEPEGESCSWPFNKENGFSFEGISDNTGGAASGHDNLPVAAEDPSLTLAGPPSRSPLKERNKSSPVALTPSPAGVKAVGGSRKGNLNGFLREFAGRRSRKTSTVEPPLISKLVCSPGSDSGSSGSDWASSSLQDTLGKHFIGAYRNVQARLKAEYYKKEILKQMHNSIIWAQYAIIASINEALFKIRGSLESLNFNKQEV